VTLASGRMAGKATDGCTGVARALRKPYTFWGTRRASPGQRSGPGPHLHNRSVHIQPAGWPRPAACSRLSRLPC
jgi:hypothetical protein